MLKKLLKYDFKAMLKYWWIAAISSIALSFIGIFCMQVLTSEKDLPTIAYAVSYLLLFTMIIGFLAFAILSTIFIFARFYKNFFTDEGYLTFTLPVSKSKLLLSKLISASVTTFMTAIILIIDALIIWAASLGDYLFTDEFWNEVTFLLESIVDEFGNYTAVYAVEVILILLAYMVFSILLLFCCLTFGSIITKKAKIITSIGIYYGVTSVFGFIVQILALFGFSTVEQWLNDLNIPQIKAAVALIMLAVLLFIAMLCMILYSVQYYMLDRKLNLS